MLIITNDPTAFLERNGLATTLRAPAARLDLGANPMTAYPMGPPLPQPELVIATERPSSPDTGTARPWPPSDGD